MKLSTPRTILAIAVLTCSLFLSLVGRCLSLSESARLSRGRLSEVLTTASGKLSFSPEIIIPEPTDPTAILLQNSKLSDLSAKLRTDAKANAIFLSGKLSRVETVASEQEEARGSFPGPVPIVYCPAESDDIVFADLASAGASGVLLSAGESGCIIDNSFGERFREALACGVQPIPEVLLSTGAEHGEGEVMKVLDSIREACGCDPVSVLLTLDLLDAEAMASEDGDEAAEVSLPSIPKGLNKMTAVLGSVRVPVGDDRMGSYTRRLKSAGFAGALLRADCVPGFRINPDLNVVAKFWSAAISSLKSTKSKNFSLRVKNNLGRDIAREWFEYQKDVMGSGALGEKSKQAASIDIENGDFVGF